MALPRPQRRQTKNNPYFQNGSFNFVQQSSRDERGRVLRSSNPNQKRAVDLENQLLAASRGNVLQSASTLPFAESEPNIERQNIMVAKALEYVAKVADQDESLRWPNDPDTEAARMEALAEMMGLRTDSTIAEELLRDASMHRARRSKDIVEAIRGCQTFECIKMAHTRPMGMAKFNFPHFFIIGWQKTATTSLFAHLNFHPEISRPWDKEPEFFSLKCIGNIPPGWELRLPELINVPAACRANDTVDYITRVLRSSRYSGFDGAKAQYEASTHYSRLGEMLAKPIHELFPWLKIVASLREPISRAASMLVHLIDKNVNVNGVFGGCLAVNNMDLGHCLLHESHISGDTILGPTEYFRPLKAWIDAFPVEQIFITQFENLTSPKNERKELVRLKKFLGIDPKLPDAASGHATLGMNNARRDKVNPDGWPMRREVYEQIVELVRPDCEAVTSLLTQKGLGDGAAWMASWERIWQDNLNSCTPEGDCVIRLS